ncbi:MAG: hypothetical protein IT448_02755 [Phycisphaerales bacterium]|nr:hypothetical protein [Phycisphaerales bacterium]
MDHHDAEITEVVVVLNQQFANQLTQARQMLEEAGMTIDSEDHDNGVMHGSIDSKNLHALEKLPCVQYLRPVFTYVADYPTGDPRDKDDDLDDNADEAPDGGDPKHQ